MTNPFDWDYLTTPLRDIETFGPFSMAFLVLFAGTFLISALIYYLSDRRLAGNPILRRAVRNATQIMMWLTAIGLFFFSWRLMRIDFATLYMRFWTLLFSLLYAGTIGYFAFWYLRTYPRQKAEVARLRERQRYIPGAAPVTRGRRKARRGIR